MNVVGQSGGEQQHENTDRSSEKGSCKEPCQDPPQIATVQSDGQPPNIDIDFHNQQGELTVQEVLRDVKELAGADYIPKTAESTADKPTAKVQVLIIVQRNKHGSRAAADYERMTDLTSSKHGRKKIIVKVNNLLTEEKSFLRSYREIDPRIDKECSMSVADQLIGEIGVRELNDRMKGKNTSQEQRNGGIYSLNYLVMDMIKDGRAYELDQWLEKLKADLGNEKAKEAISKHLKLIYKFILDNADTAVATPVVASQLADMSLFNPKVIVYDEAGMMTKVRRRGHYVREAWKEAWTFMVSLSNVYSDARCQQ